LVVGDGAAAPLIEKRSVDEVSVLIVEGSPDLASYAVLRDALLKYVMQMPRAVVVDLQTRNW
jgi:hypothetical protein